MRKAFVDALIRLAAADERVVLLTADMGYNALEPFIQRYPKRFCNVGVAEQNMVALATGLAESGLRPYCYSIASFSVLRPYEFIRNGPVLHHLPVRIVGMGGGVEYGPNGISHFAIEDIGVLRAQSTLALFAPADGAQAHAIFEQTAALPGPIYYRLEKDDSLAVPGLGGRFGLSRPELLVVGRDLLFVTMGGITLEAVTAAEELKQAGLHAGIAIASTLNPVDRAAWARLLRGYRAVITVESHGLNGGLGSLMAEIMTEHAIHIQLERRGITRTADGVIGSRSFLHQRNGLTAAQLADAARALLRVSSNPN